MILSTEPVTKHFVYLSTLFLSQQHKASTNHKPELSVRQRQTKTTTTTRLVNGKDCNSSNNACCLIDGKLSTTTTQTTTRITPEQQQCGCNKMLSKVLNNEQNEAERWLHDYEIPENYRQPGILSGYVPIGSSYTVCIRSLFTITSNESANFWSHLFAILYFVISAVRLPYDWSHQYTWPLLAYFFTVCSYLGASCLAHAFGAVSPLHMDTLFFIDYAGVSMFSFGAGLVCRAYSFPSALTDTAYGDGAFLVGSLLMVGLGTGASCSSRIRRARNSRCHRSANDALLRCCAFLLPYLWNNVPLLVRIVSEWPTPSAWCHMQQVALSIAAGVSYGSGWPELIAPGHFDTLGHSHNLLHLFGTWATQRQMTAILMDMTDTSAEMPLATSDHVTRLSYWAVYGTAMAVLINVVIIVAAVATSRPLHATAVSCDSCSQPELTASMASTAKTDGLKMLRRQSQRIKQRNTHITQANN